MSKQDDKQNPKTGSNLDENATAADKDAKASVASKSLDKPAEPKATASEADKNIQSEPPSASEKSASAPASASRSSEKAASQSASSQSTNPSAASKAAKPNSSVSASTASTQSSSSSDMNQKKENASAAQNSANAASAKASSGGSNQSKSAKRKSQGGGGSKLGLIALIIALLVAIAMAVLGYFGWQKTQQQQSELSQLSETQNAVSGLQSRLDDSDQNSANSTKMIQGEFEDYRKEMDQNLDKVLGELSKKQQADPREWVHAEVEYLLRMANQRLQLERDVKGALGLLQAADDRLREVDNPALLPVRRQVQSEIAELNSVPKVDSTGIYLTLIAQEEQLARLPLKQDVEEAAAGKGDTKPSGGWKEQLGTLGNALKDLVSVRKHDQPLEALITPSQEAYLRQNVSLMLEQAQLAVLKSEPEVFKASLAKAQKLVAGYYAPDQDGVKNVLEKLKSLEEQDIQPELPDISESAQTMKQFIEQRFSNKPQADSAEGASA